MVDRQLFSSQFYVNSIIGITQFFNYTKHKIEALKN